VEEHEIESQNSTGNLGKRLNSNDITMKKKSSSIEPQTNEIEKSVVIKSMEDEPSSDSNFSVLAGVPISSNIMASPIRKKLKTKKKSYLGISGYQRVCADGDNSLTFTESTVSEPKNITTNSQDTSETIISTSLSSSTLLASAEKPFEVYIPISTSTSTPAPTVASTSHERGASDLENSKKDIQMSILNQKSPLLIIPERSQFYRERCLPFYSIELPDKPDIKMKKTSTRYLVDYQVGLMMGFKSGRALLEKFPYLLTRVATTAEKTALESSPLATVILDCLILTTGAKWVKRNDGGNGVRLTDLDIMFLQEEQVRNQVLVSYLKDDTCPDSLDSKAIEPILLDLNNYGNDFSSKPLNSSSSKPSHNVTNLESNVFPLASTPRLGTQSPQSIQSQSRDDVVEDDSGSSSVSTGLYIHKLKRYGGASLPLKAALKLAKVSDNNNNNNSNPIL